ncbi:hypothetical protein [Paraburkholderia aromaticivorans]|uniref:hypothetical protein n=1 Tax=Paraburkholderia aromaticivorans TaxID=2026199 RepID=UPI0012FD35A7|nr:hypothetical protein [Paraburkholderia aromaticivorans]
MEMLLVLRVLPRKLRAFDHSIIKISGREPYRKHLLLFICITSAVVPLTQHGDARRAATLRLASRRDFSRILLPFFHFSGRAQRRVFPAAAFKKKRSRVRLRLSWEKSA